MSAPIVGAGNGAKVTNGGRPANQNAKPVTPTAKPAKKSEFSSDLFDHAPVDEVLLATAGYDHTIKFWQAHTGQCVRTVQHADSQVNAMEISPDGQLLAACGYQHIRMYDAQGASGGADPIVNYEGVSKNVMGVGFQEQCRWMYTGGEDGTVKIWDLRARNLQCQKVFQANAPVNSVTLHPNQQEIIVGDQNGVVHLWNLRSDKSETVTPEIGVSIQCVAVDSKGKLMAAVTNKGSCHVWDMKTDEAGKTIVEPKKKILAHKRYALKCKFSPDSSFLATSSADQRTKLWRSSDLELITELYVENQRWVWDIAFSADSQYLFTATSDNVARLWSLPNNEVKREYIGHQKSLTCLAFRDGQSG